MSLFPADVRWPILAGLAGDRLCAAAVYHGGVSGAHEDLVREQFGAQAGTFTDEGFAARGLAWIVGQLAPAGGELVLDVAAGAAHLGRALAPRVAQVCALDLTPQMLAQGRRLAAAHGLPNVAFLAGDAAALPWAGQRFDLVVCRLALHQAADPPAVVGEMLRVTRRSGRIGITDMIAAGDPVVAAGHTGWNASVTPVTTARSPAPKSAGW